MSLIIEVQGMALSQEESLITEHLWRVEYANVSSRHVFQIKKEN